MSEKKFLASVYLEGIMLFLLGVSTLIIPKLTPISFGIVLSCVFLTIGLYKIIYNLFNRNYSINMLFAIFHGAMFFIVGLLLLFVPKINIFILVALVGVNFLIESISLMTFVSQIKNVYNFWSCNLAASIILYCIGVLILLTFPLLHFWFVVALSGLCFLTEGISKIAIYLINKNNYKI